MQVSVIRSRRKTMSVEVSKEGEVLVRAPLRMPEWEIRRFLTEKEAWILSHVEKMKARQKETAPERLLTKEEIRKLAESALQDIPERVRRFAPLVGVTYGGITVRNQKTRWGSCSAKGNLNFNCLLMLSPPEVRDYVVVHELCHRLEMNHSARFWAEVARVLPDYAAPRKWLRVNGTALMRRMTG